MSMYKNFAYVYDRLMEDVPYNDWISYIEEIFKRYGVKPAEILDLGCGTGNVLFGLLEKGYDVIGLDKSEDMLCVAREKAEVLKKDVLFVCQDMREIDLYGTVDCVISLCDSINYILEKDGLTKVFELVNNYLNPEGLFIFDFNTFYKLSEVLGDGSFSIIKDNLVCAWENNFDAEEKISEYYTNIFISEGENYKRFSEFHYERAYSLEEILDAIEKSGLKFLGAFEENTFDAPNEFSERIYIVARENGKRRK